MIEPHVIVLEDDAGLRRLLSRGLSEEGFHVTTVSDASALFGRVAADEPQALIIDIGLPDADGRDVVHALRARGMGAPVIFLTARDGLPDRLSGFAAGGDDYLTKPFALAELVARLRALLRRGGADRVVQVGDLRLDPASLAASCEGETVRLSPTEFRILASLAAHSGEIVRRSVLVRAGWPHGAIVHDNTLDVYIATLRRKLRRLPGAPEIATAHGVGYTLG